MSNHLPASIQDGLEPDAIAEIIGERFELRRDDHDNWGHSLILSDVAKIRDLLSFVRDDERLRFDMLLDITGIDYLAYPGWRDERYAVVYVLKSLHFRHRLRIKVLVDEGEESVPSVHDLFKIADWSEREVYDQYGIHFEGHPNLKRILNHHEFVGHPLRKDYPVQKRQHLSINDPMLDELTALLVARGFRIIDAEATSPAGIDPAAPTAGGVA